MKRKPVKIIIVCIILLIIFYIVTVKTRSRRFRRTPLITRKNLGDHPKVKRGNRCTCSHPVNFGGRRLHPVSRPCGRKAEMGKLAEPGLCKQCRQHGPHGKDRREWDDI